MIERKSDNRNKQRQFYLVRKRNYNNYSTSFRLVGKYIVQVKTIKIYKYNLNKVETNLYTIISSMYKCEVSIVNKKSYDYA